ncbi:hypothetical protein GCM10010207_15440 [Streptomyces atratus]|uniref:hypothetical protein n=1 Tax=Streptomyces atratus TaxID=1893 RepID=UPI0016716500|nr:hypothetical protein [Streptomyces atratus]GGT17131.1 hypothetical protein GCM10010207_15440 [Streptomyces atratus]
MNDHPHDGAGTDADAQDCVNDLRAALAAHGVTLPSLGIDPAEVTRSGPFGDVIHRVVIGIMVCRPARGRSATLRGRRLFSGEAPMAGTHSSFIADSAD